MVLVSSLMIVIGIIFIGRVVLVEIEARATRCVYCVYCHYNATINAEIVMYGLKIYKWFVYALVIN